MNLKVTTEPDFSMVKNDGRGFFKGRWPGLTLVELLVVIAISLIVSAVAFTIYRINTGYYLREEAFIQQQQNLRAAFYVLGQSLRMAGNGLKVLGPDVSLIQVWSPSQVIVNKGNVSISPNPGWFSHPGSSAGGARAIFGIDGGPKQADVVTLFRAEVEYPAPLGLVQQAGGNFVDLNGPVQFDTLADRNIIALVNKTQATLLEVDRFESNRIYFVKGGRFTGPSGPPGNFPTIGSSVYNLRDVSLVTYYVDQQNFQLMAAHHDLGRLGYDVSANKSVIVANNIEDLQIYYYYAAEVVDPESLGLNPDLSLARLNRDRVKALGLAMTSRSGYGEGAYNRRRPALFNREEGSVPDNRRRNTLAEFIYLRN
ncbi:MAG: prepilin-type N-terminal cleavage/methylation domain-containing protein [Deltaproteobacteria bacterium]|nr:prepilin-type N-terminal cleavage/methylation domain-containing protein [Deltaproteobacteria bacterium]